MNLKSVPIVSIILLCVLLNVCPSHACYKKLKALIKNRGREEKPAELAREESAFIKNSHARSNNFYIEIIQNENKTFVVRELDHPIIVMNQVKDEFEEKAMDTQTEPDAEYINANETDTQNNNSLPTTTEMIPPARPLQTADEEEEPPLSPEDATVRKEWQGKCTVADWNRCNKIREIVVHNVHNVVINNQFHPKHLELDCLLEPILCLKNGWTANRCHILCMAAQCNRALFVDWDGFVDFEGPCNYRK